MKRHFPGWVFAGHRGAGCPWLRSPPTPQPSLSGEAEAYTLQPGSFRDDPLTRVRGEVRASCQVLPLPPTNPFLIFTDGLLRGDSDSFLGIGRTLRPTGGSSTLLSEKMSQKRFAHPVNPNRWPFPWIPREAAKQPTLSPAPNQANERAGLDGRWAGLAEGPGEKHKRYKNAQRPVSCLS